jgi:acyl carrier protein
MTNRILNVLTGIRPEFDFSASEDYIADGMLDSIDVIALVSDLDKAFSICIEGTDILPENFRNLSAIRELLHKYGADA